MAKRKTTRTSGGEAKASTSTTRSTPAARSGARAGASGSRASDGRSSGPRFGYPRPQAVREQWTSLDGQWAFAIDRDGTLTSPDAVEFDRSIEVPFVPESPMSGVEETGFCHAVWYRREVPAPAADEGSRIKLHFGAVDYEATVWVNGMLVGTHEGGYTSFSFDITEAASAAGESSNGTDTIEIVVCARDNPHDMGKPRGKQDWHEKPHGIWYHRTTGIWQTVWMEVVPQTHIARLHWQPDAERWEIGYSVEIAGPVEAGMQLRVELSIGGRTLARDVVSLDLSNSITASQIKRAVQLVDPGVDAARDDLLWFPWRPNLIDARIELLDPSGQAVDTLASYTAMRTVRIVGDRFFLNGKPFYLRLALDQGYWLEGGLTPPDEEAFRKDIELTKQMGFNGVRKHQKIESPRFLHLADKMGLLVWEEMPGAYQFSDKAITRLTRQWTEVIERDRSHPCIVAWMPFNESWGVPDLGTSEAQQNAVNGLYFLTKSLDPSRPVIGNDGWEFSMTDIFGVHDYDRNPKALAKRYKRDREDFLHTEQPGHRVLLIDGYPDMGQPIMLTEFGGIAFTQDKNAWGYSTALSADDFRVRYGRLLAAVRSVKIFSGFCYTQLTDTYQEANGLLYMDRTPKIPIDQIRRLTEGAWNPQQDEELERLLEE